MPDNSESDESGSNKPAPDAPVEWFIYMIRCNSGHLYTGISTDVARRFAEHQRGKGAKYLRGKGPLELVYQKKIGTHSVALKTEAMVKKMPKIAKENMIHTA